MLNVIDFIRESIKDSRALRSLFVRRYLSCSVTKGANWESVDIDVQLIGMCLRVYLTATRKSPTGTGNIVNEDVCTVEIDTRGMFDTILNACFCSGSTGPIAVFNTANVGKTENGVKFDIRIAATEGAVTNTNAYFYMLVVPDLETYRSGGGVLHRLPYLRKEVAVCLM